MLSIQDRVNTADTTALGLVESKVYFDSAIHYYNGLPYLQRNWDIEATNNDNGKVRIYFTQAEANALSLNFYNQFPLNLAQNLFLLEFDDSITFGLPDTIPFTVINISGNNAIPFNNTVDVLGIEFETSTLGAYILQVRPDPILLPLDLVSFEVSKNSAFSSLLKWSVKFSLASK